MARSTNADGAIVARSRAMTRAGLLKVARELLVERDGRTSVQDITRRAGVGVAVLLEHFPAGRQGLFQEAVLELLDRYAVWLHAVTSELADAAEIFACGFRLTGRLAVAERALLTPLLSRGSEVVSIERGLRTAAVSDLEAGMAQGRFEDLDCDVVLMAVGAMFLGLLHLLVDHPARVTDQRIDALAAAALRMLGVEPAEAAEIVTRPLPALPAVSTLL